MSPNYIIRNRKPSWFFLAYVRCHSSTPLGTFNRLQLDFTLWWFIIPQHSRIPKKNLTRLVSPQVVATNQLRTMLSILLVITATFRRSRNFLSHHPQSKKCFERICRCATVRLSAAGERWGLNPRHWRAVYVPDRIFWTRWCPSMLCLLVYHPCSIDTLC